MATPPFSAISLLQAAHARNTPPPWWHLEEGAEGAEGSGRQGGWGWLVGLAAGWWQGGWGLGLAGGSGGMVAWWHGCMEGNDRFRYIYIYPYEYIFTCLFEYMHYLQIHVSRC